MLQTVLHFFMHYRRFIYLFLALAGLIVYFVAEHLRKKERRNPGSVSGWRSKAVALYIASLIVWIGVIIALFLDGYYDQFLGWLIGK
ncbi:MAG: hypothetical protein K2H45_15635 [Acetatifactor sp.]|nr:hypothetical protein [Acetatifactor sp.]